MKQLTLLCALLLLAACSAPHSNTSYAQVPPALQTLSDDWEADLPPRVTYTTPSGDEALVLSDSAKYIRAVYQGVTYAACPDQGAALFTMDDLAQTADSVLRHGAPYDGQSLWIARTECVTTFRALTDSL